MKKKGVDQAIILAAGKSTRTLPLTSGKPKALLEVANQAIIEHNLDSLQGLVKEALVVIGFEGHQIKQRIGHRRGLISVTYAEQLQQLGTAQALKCAESRAHDQFLVLMGDDLYAGSDVIKLLKHRQALLAQKVSDISQFGTVKEKGKVLAQITEKPKLTSEGYANTGCYMLGREVFSAIKGVKKSERGEFELVDAINILAAKGKMAVEEAENWHPITYPWSLLDANERLLAGLKPTVHGTVERGATMKGAVAVGKGTVIKAGSYIEGPVTVGSNCTIGPNCYVRAHSSIGDNCVVGNASEVKNSILMRGTHVGHLSYVGDSILGENVNLGASTITANLRHDNKTVKSMLKGQLLDTGRRKLGAIIGDNVHTGIHTTIYPGRKIWPGQNTLPGEVVKRDIEAG